MNCFFEFYHDLIIVFLPHTYSICSCDFISIDLDFFFFAFDWFCFKSLFSFIVRLKNPDGLQRNRCRAVKRDDERHVQLHGLDVASRVRRSLHQRQQVEHDVRQGVRRVQERVLLPPGHDDRRAGFRPRALPGRCRRRARPDDRRPPVVLHERPVQQVVQLQRRLVRHGQQDDPHG